MQMRIVYKKFYTEHSEIMFAEIDQHLEKL